MAGQLGLPQGLWSHLPPEVEEGRLIEYCSSLIGELPKRGMTLEQYLEFMDRQQGVRDDGSSNVVRLPRA